VSGMFGPLLVGLLFILVPVLVLIGVIALLRKNKTGMRRITSIPAGWRATKARVTEGNVEEAIRTRVEDDPFYYPMVAFEYTVEGGHIPVPRASNGRIIMPGGQRRHWRSIRQEAK